MSLKRFHAIPIVLLVVINAVNALATRHAAEAVCVAIDAAANFRFSTKGF